MTAAVFAIAQKKKKQKDTMVGFSTDADSSGTSQVCGLKLLVYAALRY